MKRLEIVFIAMYARVLVDVEVSRASQGSYPSIDSDEFSAEVYRRAIKHWADECETDIVRLPNW